MEDDFHIDMSGKLHRGETVGIACYNDNTKEHSGCALQRSLIKALKKHLFRESQDRDHAKLYAICVFILIKEEVSNTSRLIICNDENFHYVRIYLSILLKNNPEISNTKIISISELRKTYKSAMNDSLADRYARPYRKRALNKVKWGTGINLKVNKVDYNTIKYYWSFLDNKM